MDKRLVIFLMILMIFLSLAEFAFSESPYIVKKGNIVEELSLTENDVYVYGYVKLLNLGTGDVKVFEGGKVDKLRVGAGDVEIRGKVKNIQVGLGNVTVYGVVKGDIEVGLGDVILKSNSIVEGDIKVVGEVKREKGAVVKGEIESTQLPKIPFFSNLLKNREFLKRFPMRFGFGTKTIKIPKIVTFFIFLFVYFLILALFPNATRRGIQYLTEKPMNSFLLSLILLAFGIGIAIVLVITIIGILLIPLVLAGIFAFYLFGTTIFYTTIGERILKLMNVENPNPILCYFIAAVPLLLIRIFIPYGGLISVISLLFGFGAGFKAAFPKLVIFNI